MPGGGVSLFGGTRFGRVSVGTIVAVIAVSLAWAFGAGWAGVLKGDAALLPFMVPDDVLHGQVWRLLTYAWIEPDIMTLFFAVWGLAVFLPNLEESWGERALLRRMAMMVVVPAALTTLLSLVVPSLRDIPFYGTSALITCLVVAFATELHGRQITLFPLPFTFGGDQILWLEGGVLAAYIIYHGTILPHLLSIVSLAFALGWFRFNIFRDVRRNWLRLRRRQLEVKMTKLRRRGTLRVVSPDEDDEEPRRFLH